MMRRRMLMTAGGFDPLSLSPLILYNPADIGTLWQDTAGTTAVTAAGQTVKRIDDISGNGYHATGSTGPLWASDGSLDFTGLSAFLNTVAIDLSTTPQLTVIVGVYKGADTFGQLVGQGDSRDTNGGWGLDMSAASITAGRDDYRLSVNKSEQASIETASGFAAPITNVLTAALDMSQTGTDQCEIRVDGAVSFGGGLGGTAPSASGLFNLAINLGSRESAGAYAEAKLYDIIVVPRLLSATELADAEGYVADRIGVTL